MKVLHVIPGLAERDGGPSHAVVDLCQALLDLNSQTTLATTRRGLDARVDATIKMRLTRGRVEVFPSAWGGTFKYSRPLAKWLRYNIGSFDLVHIHAVFNHSSFAAARACRASGVPYIVRPLGTLGPWGMKQKPMRKKLFWYTAGKKMLQEAAAVHYTSEGERQAVEQSLHLKRGFIVPLGVHFKNGSGSDLLLSELLPGFDGNPYVLVLSRLLPTKGIDVLLDAFLSLVQRQEFMNWRLVLAGEGPLEFVNSLQEKIMQNVASDFVRFTGWLSGSQKDLVLRNASLLALPSEHENFGLCVIEALSYGVPVLVSQEVGLANEIVVGGAGWVTETDVNSLEQTLATAFGSESERLRRGAAGRKLARRFDWKVVAEQLSNVYERIISEKAQRDPRSHTKQH